MNRYIESALKVDMGRVIILLTKDLINPHVLLDLIVADEWTAQAEEDLLDYVDRDEVEDVLYVRDVVKELIKDLTDSHLNALRLQMITMGVEPEIACEDCGGIILKSCTCEA